jgi:hypothetical protein
MALSRYQRYWTYKRNVPHLRPGEKLDFRRRKGYFIVPPPPPIKPPPLTHMLTLQRTLFWATIDGSAIEYACRMVNWRHALTADSGTAVPTPEQVAQLKTHSLGVDAWGVQTQIGAIAIQRFHDHYGLDRIIHQAENQPEADIVDARYVIGNFTREGIGVNNWAEFKHKVEEGQMACTQEAYDGNPADDSTQGLPISSYTLGVWMDAGKHYALRDLLQKIPPGARSGVCIWHATPTLLDDADRAALMAL